MKEESKEVGATKAATELKQETQLEVDVKAASYDLPVEAAQQHK